MILKLVHTYETRPHDFNQRTFLRIFGSLLFELSVPDPTLDLVRPQVLVTFAAGFLALQLSRLPGFAFAWLEVAAPTRNEGPAPIPSNLMSSGADSSSRIACSCQRRCYRRISVGGRICNGSSFRCLPFSSPSSPPPSSRLRRARSTVAPCVCYSFCCVTWPGP